ncbi:MAG: DUF2652 domain-containing protein [Ignavibacteriaceae bacterium]|nr:DUF2652 domain-containing protein [Ignavibacteriaceae bacterium]
MTAQLFIPDISGFSKFVNETEMVHGQEIISALLETIIESNHLAMDIYEIEGDAIVFYNYDKNFTPSQFHDISINILNNFKNKIEFLKKERICECNACKSIINLSLKFIVHKDELNEIKVKNFTKLYGRGLIIAHLLLKNKIQSKEYLLFTFDYLKTQDEKPLAGFVEYYHNSPALGPISTKYIEL